MSRLLKRSEFRQVDELRVHGRLRIRIRRTIGDDQQQPPVPGWHGFDHFARCRTVTGPAPHLRGQFER